MQIEKYSLGIGDRFAHQGKPQLQALQTAKQHGIEIVPVWNKSYREHQIIHSAPESVRREADQAVRSLGWSSNYYVDADHISLSHVDLFWQACDFFTIDISDFIGRRADEDAVADFTGRQESFVGELHIPGLDQQIEISKKDIAGIAGNYLKGLCRARTVYEHIASHKGADNFITEISLDETAAAQRPVDLLFILKAIAELQIPIQTIAPKFTGRFHKGVDYVGDRRRFSLEFEQDLAIINYAVKKFHLPENLKLSVHSGSDKFSLYPVINQAIRKFDAGLHLKTAGTTWLEELIGLAEGGADGLELAREIYRSAYSRLDELRAPYATVIDIDPTELPQPGQVDKWSGQEYAATLRHDPCNRQFNRHFRQLLHVGYKVAAELGERYLQALEQNEQSIAKNVTENLYERHIKPLFMGKQHYI